ncbi:MAG: fibronectin type III domain-containing protein [Emergencia sp.]|nr:fibronectin type III domain-containing protein [Emergencia sp.]
MKRILNVLLSVTMALTLVLAAPVSAHGASVSWKTAMSKTESYMTKKLTNPTYGDEWALLGLARNGAAVTDAVYNKYCKNLEQVLADKKGVLDARKYSEYSKVILTLTAMGKDPTNIGGYNLFEKVADFEMVKKQGINGPVWALLALDCGNYEIPEVEGISQVTSRELLIEMILSQEKEGGGFALTGDTADVDITAMVLTALAPYDTRSDVGAAIDRAIAVLSEKQLADGGFETLKTPNAESSVQVIVALTSLGIDPSKDKRFIKNGKSVLDALLTYYAAGGGFRHVNKAAVGYEPVVNGLATAQGYYGLTAYSRFLDGKNTLYDMKDGKTIARPVATSISSLKSLKTKQMTVKWKKVSGVKGYQIVYAANSKFTSSKSVTATASSVQKTIRSLKKGKTYYVKIRAYKDNGGGGKLYGAYCTVKKVKVK